MENYSRIPWSTSAALRRFHWHVLLLAIGVSVLWQQEQRGGRTSGAAEAQSCGPRISARFLLDIPCDMTRSAFCNVAGSSYPWHAVRRYIFENQGLVRRMYGDQRHSVIVGSEIEARRMRYDDLRFHEPESLVPPVSAVHRTRARAAYRVRPNSRYANLLKTSPLADGEKARPPPPPPPPPPPSLRPPAHTDATVGMATTTAGTSPVTAAEATGDSPVTTAPALLDADAYRPGSPTQVVFHGEPVDMDTPTRLATGAPHNQEPGAILTTPTTPTHTLAAAVTTREHPSTGTSATTTTEAGDFEPSYAAGEPFTHEPEPLHAYATSQASTAASQPLFSLLDSNSIEAPDRDDSSHSHGRPVTAAASVNHPDDHAEEDISASTEQPPPAEPLRRGVNACPVKQEVLAPYWANNTRGKVLALLNVYPFEQYVHAEKCAFENQQMFCRDGCRCEQQFRLHRLLAFDPRNECRGIFADWFRFPSCCVCICYDLGSPASRWTSSGRGT